MKNAVLPLDDIFVNSAVDMITIHECAEPLTERSSVPGRPAQCVVEVSAAFVARHGVRAGDSVRWTRQ